jgi:hypothetical protein
MPSTTRRFATLIAAATLILGACEIGQPTRDRNDADHTIAAAFPAGGRRLPAGKPTGHPIANVEAAQRLVASSAAPTSSATLAVAYANAAHMAATSHADPGYLCQPNTQPGWLDDTAGPVRTWWTTQLASTMAGAALAWKFSNCGTARLTGIWAGEQSMTSTSSPSDPTTEVTYSGTWLYRLTSPQHQVAYTWLSTTVTYSFGADGGRLEALGWRNASWRVLPGLGDRLPPTQAHPVQARDDLRPRRGSTQALRAVRQALAATLRSGQAEVSFTRSSGPAGTTPIGDTNSGLIWPAAGAAHYTLIPDSYGYAEEVITNRVNDYSRDRASTGVWPWTSYHPNQPDPPYGDPAPSDSNPFVALGLVADTTTAAPAPCDTNTSHSGQPSHADRCYLLTVPVGPMLRVGHITAGIASAYAAFGMDHVTIKVDVHTGRIASIRQAMNTGYGQPDTDNAWVISLTGYRAGHPTGIAATGPLSSPRPPSPSAGDDPRYWRPPHGRPLPND